MELFWFEAAIKVLFCTDVCKTVLIEETTHGSEIKASGI
jgi:hypothetical protein